jgi:hypothetical protein
LYEIEYFIINCKRTNETAMLKSADHDSMSGEHVGTTSGLIVTSANQEFGHWQPLKIKDLESYKNSQGREKT